MWSWKKGLPLVSLVIGVASSFSMARGMDLAWRLEIAVLVFAVALVSLPKSLGLIDLCLDKLILACTGKMFFQRCARLLLKLKALLRHSLAPVFLQSLQQYIIFFCLPFLYLSQALLIFVIGLLLCLTTLWDPWYFYLMERQFYRRILRCYCFFVSAAFLISIEFVHFLPYFNLIIFVICLLSVFPFTLFKKHYISLESIVLQFCGVFVLLFFVFLKAFFDDKIKVPLLSLWLQSGSSKIAIKQSRGFESKGYCCYTAIVAPRKLTINVFHQWSYNNKNIDKILLPAIQGNSDLAAYRTFSCKENLPEINQYYKFSAKFNEMLTHFPILGELVPALGQLKCSAVAEFVDPIFGYKQQYTIGNLRSFY